ncbi:cadherin-like domain-containing protein [Nostoc punctiforme UO1]|uniref:cadherin-like domain-containing protein n=1 Tax=Nostoc punctiforme TaxID=272131 RepID=UPI0030A6ABBC
MRSLSAATKITTVTEEDTAVNILASTILNRYSHVDGDTLSITGFTNPANGTLAFNDNGTVGNPNDDYFVYTPNATNTLTASNFTIV